MTHIAHSRAVSPAAFVTLMLVSGAAGTVAFDLWGQAVAPALGLGNLSPVGLARSLLGKLALPADAAAGSFMHLFLVGLVGYPLGWLLIARPLLRQILPGLGWLPASVLYGIGLWVFAIGLIAWFALGQPFLGFARIAWVALIGHVLYAIAAAATVLWSERR